MTTEKRLSNEKMLSTAIILGKDLGLCIKRKKRPAIAYDGTYAYASNAEDAFHEIGHWVVCAPGRRCVAGYGLGTDYLGTWCPRLVSYNDANTEERKASALGIWMLWMICKQLAVFCAAKEFWVAESEVALLSDISRSISNEHKKLIRSSIRKNPSLRERMNVEAVSIIDRQ